jgi:hypothetical protein
MNGINAQVSSTNGGPRRFAWLLSSLALRILIALLISGLFFLTFFVSSVVSR